MQINNSINAMNNLDLKLNGLAQDVASATSVTKPNEITTKQNQEVTPDLINAIVEQIPTVISYEANANAIKTQNAVHDALLDIKA